MSEELNTQAAVEETNAPAVQGAEATNAQDGDDLESLLAEFDEGKSKPSEPAKPEPKVEAANESQVANETVLNEARFIRQERFKKDMELTVKEVRGELPSDFFDDRFVQAWIDARAMDDDRLGQAWTNRYENPAGFKKVVGALSKEFAKKYGRLPDKQATEDREAVTAAVRGASTKVPEGKAPDFSRMTPAEFQAEKDKMFG